MNLATNLELTDIIVESDCQDNMVRKGIDNLITDIANVRVWLYLGESCREGTMWLMNWLLWLPTISSFSSACFG